MSMSELLGASANDYKKKKKKPMNKYKSDISSSRGQDCDDRNYLIFFSGVTFRYFTCKVKFIKNTGVTRHLM